MNQCGKKKAGKIMNSEALGRGPEEHRWNLTVHVVLGDSDTVLELVLRETAGGQGCRSWSSKQTHRHS